MWCIIGGVILVPSWYHTDIISFWYWKFNTGKARQSFNASIIMILYWQYFFQTGIKDTVLEMLGKTLIPVSSWYCTGNFFSLWYWNYNNGFDAYEHLLANFTSCSLLTSPTTHTCSKILTSFQHASLVCRRGNYGEKGFVRSDFGQTFLINREQVSGLTFLTRVTLIKLFFIAIDARMK
jgi:hypothetical protein